LARPSKYSKKIAEEILSRYADGETLSAICKDKNMPKRNTVYRWRQSYPEFGNAYQRAQEGHVDALVDQAGEIVDTEQNPQLARVRADHRRWLASKLCRNKYGDKLEVNHKQTIDIGPALLAANKRMQEIGAGYVMDTPVKQLGEADSDTI
jgi:hypothetical protein